MPRLNLPPSLGPGIWEKHKGVLAKVADAPKTRLGDELKALAKLHAAFEWSVLEVPKGGKVDAKALLQGVDAAEKGPIKSIVAKARSVADEASRFAAAAAKLKNKSLDAPVAAASSVDGAVDAYLSEIGEAVADAIKGLRVLLTAPPAGDPAKPGAEPPAAKLVRTRALDAIRKAKKPKPGAGPTRFVIVQGKKQVATYLGPSVGPTQEKLLKGLLKDDGPFKTFKDPKGQLLWEKNALTLVSDTLPSGLAKKMQLWLKAILKLNLRLRVRNSKNDVEETDGDELGDEALRGDEGDDSRSEAFRVELMRKLGDHGPAIKRAIAGPLAGEVRALWAQIQKQQEAGDLDEADALLETLDAVLEKADALDLWHAERAEAETTLKLVAAKVAQARHASSAKGVLEIEAVLKALKQATDNAAAVAGLQAFIADDPVLADVSELATDIRTPLLHALADLHVHLDA